MTTSRWMACAAVFAVACSRSAGVGSPTPPPSSTAQPAPNPAQAWPIRREEHVDLWLHGFAMLTSDTAKVPFFERGYRQRISAIKKQQGAFSLLDANQSSLAARFASNPALTNAQFLALYFDSWDEMARAVNALVQTQGNPGASSDPGMQQQIAVLAGAFHTNADRDWARLFTQSLQDESSKFYHGYW